jgi:hypothetical protein
MDDLVIAALQEAGIDRAEGLASRCAASPAAKVTRMLFGNADVKAAGRGSGLAMTGQGRCRSASPR